MSTECLNRLIETRYMPATETLPARVVARYNNKTMYVRYREEESDYQAHLSAVVALIYDLGWSDMLRDHIGALNRKGDGYAFVITLANQPSVTARNAATLSANCSSE